MPDPDAEVDLEVVLPGLLEVGRAEQFGAVSAIPGLESHRAVVSLADAHRHAVLGFARRLSPADRRAFVKAVAVLEHSVGGLGSVTNLARLLPLCEGNDRELLNWVLRNTNSYSYYAHGAKSVEDLSRAIRQKAERAAEGIRRDSERQRQDRERISQTASARLFNAVRRGDIKAVRALIEKGASARLTTTDGQSLIEYARAAGRMDVVAELENAARHK